MKIFNKIKKKLRLQMAEVSRENSNENELNNIQKFDNIKQPDLAKHDISILDLVFLIDCTGSMRKYIESATDVILYIILV